MVTYLAIRLLYKWWMLMVFTTLVNEITMKGIALLLDMQVRRSMCRIKQVLTERALAEEDASRRKALRNMINGMWERREKWGKLRAAGEIFKRTWAERLGEIKRGWVGDCWLHGQNLCEWGEGNLFMHVGLPIINASRIHSHFEMRFCFAMTQFRMLKFKVVSS